METSISSIDVIVIIKYNQARKQKFADAYILNKKEKLTTGRFRRAGKQLKIMSSY